MSRRSCIHLKSRLDLATTLERIKSVFPWNSIMKGAFGSTVEGRMDSGFGSWKCQSGPGRLRLRNDSPFDTFAVDIQVEGCQSDQGLKFAKLIFCRLKTLQIWSMMLSDDDQVILEQFYPETAEVRPPGSKISLI